MGRPKISGVFFSIKRKAGSRGFSIFPLESASFLFLFKVIDKGMENFNALVGKHSCS